MDFSKVLYGALLTTALCIGGCSQYKAAEAPQDIAPQQAKETDLMDPLEAHRKTRAKVDPKNLEKSYSYTKHAEDYRAITDSNFRVVKLERQAEPINQEFGKIMDSVEKKTVIDPQPLKTAAAANSLRKPQTLNNIVPASGGPAVSAVRLGEHPGKTRFVMDLSGPAKYAAALDPSGKVLSVNLLNAGWTAQAAKSFSKHPLLQSYKAEQTSGGSRLVVNLKKPSKLVLNTAMKPNHAHGDRVVLDIAAL